MKDDIEKGKKVDRNVGDMHPNGVWTWTKTKSGKFDWRPINGHKGAVQTTIDDSQPATKTGVAGTVTTTVLSKTPMTPAQLVVWAKKTDEKTLLRVGSNPKGNLNLREAAYNEMKSRGLESMVNTKGTLEDHWASQKAISSILGNDDDQAAGGTTTAATPMEDDEEEDDGVTELWYLNKKDDRVQKAYNKLSTKSDRIRYDKYVDKMKKAEKNYKPAIRVMNDLGRQYLYFLKNPNIRFMLSAGGAGVGKTYTFKFLAHYENQKFFDAATDKPGEGDYDIFESPEVTGANQLASILKAHNGKTILFDDTDKILRDSRMAGMMKKATATLGKRIIDDPADKTVNFEFTGRILIMTNKDISALAENEDTKAIISRAIIRSDIRLTVPEQMEVLENRFKTMAIGSVAPLEDPAEDLDERNEIFDVIKENVNNIDPRNFTTRTFEDMINIRRAAEISNAAADDVALQAMIGTYKTDWRVDAAYQLTKAEMNEIGVPKGEFFEKGDDDLIQKSEEEIVESELDKALKDDSFNLEDMSLEKAEQLLLPFDEE